MEITQHTITQIDLSSGEVDTLIKNHLIAGSIINGEDQIQVIPNIDGGGNISSYKIITRKSII